MALSEIRRCFAEPAVADRLAAAFVRLKECSDLLRSGVCQKTIKEVANRERQPNEFALIAKRITKLENNFALLVRHSPITKGSILAAAAQNAAAGYGRPRKAPNRWSGLMRSQNILNVARSGTANKVPIKPHR